MSGFYGQGFFLDRDGTINEDRGYVYRIEDFIFLPGAIEAIDIINRHGYLAVVVTNQSGIARGYYTRRDVDYLHCYINQCLSLAGARIDAFYLCPHLPGVQCGCRKPRPGMLLRAAGELDIILGHSFMVGDKMSDIEAGMAAGCKAVLINDSRQGRLGSSGIKCAGSLLEAVHYCLKLN